jgi:ribosomal protein L40E
MNTNLLSIVKQITAQYGEKVLDDPARVKALFNDFAKDVPKSLRTAFYCAVEEGAYNALKTAPDAAERASRKAAIAQRVRDEHGIDPTLSAEALDVLEAALFGTGSPAPAPKPAAAEPAVSVAVSSSGGAGYGIALIDPPPEKALFSSVSSSLFDAVAKVFGTISPKPAAPAPAAPAVPPASAAPVCAECGAELNARWKACPECGTPRLRQK